MLESKNIFKTVPSGKYHSALFTAFSINLYYWEIRVLRELSRKGIDYVSAIVDEECLSEQFLHFSRDIDSEEPKRYSLHGFRAKGAFHPKIMFFAGKEQVLAFIGSGNLTSCGHGKNLEIWTSVSAESQDDPSFLLIRDIWGYLYALYSNLGPEALEIISTVESNCSLLTGISHALSGDEYTIGDSFVRFICNHENSSESIFAQIRDWTDGEKISEITVLSPFYDENGKMLNMLDELFKPAVFNIIVGSSDLGNIPNRKTLPLNCKVFDWMNCGHPLVSPKGQKYHAKCYFLKGTQYNYLLCGSANASVAAMGLEQASGSNYEACIGFKSTSLDYLKDSGITLPDDPYDYTDEKDRESFSAHPRPSIWLKEVSLSGKVLSISFSSAVIPGCVSLVLESTNHQKESQIELFLDKDTQHVSLPDDIDFLPTLAWLKDSNGERISGIQFVISSQEMKMSSPNSEESSFRNCCRAIEQGNFVNGDFLSFLSRFFDINEKNQSKTKTTSKPKEDKQANGSQGLENPSTFASYKEYLEGNTPFIAATNSRLDNYHKGMNLLDSILAYARNSSKTIEEQEIDSEIDNEEDDKVNKSGKEKRKIESIPVTQQQRLAKKLDDIFKVFEKYVSDLEKELLVINNEKPSSPASFDELKRFMLILFLANRLIGFSSRCDDTMVKDSLKQDCPIKYFKTNRNTLTELIIRAIALFGLYVYRHRKLDEKGLSPLYKKKMELYWNYTFEQSLALLSVCDVLNQGNQDYEIVPDYFKMTSLLNIQWACNYLKEDPNETVYLAMRAVDSDLFNSGHVDIIELQSLVENNVEALDHANHITSSLCPLEGQFFLDKRIGHVFVSKITNKIDNRFLPLSAVGKYDDSSDSYCLFSFRDEAKEDVYYLSSCSIDAKRGKYIMHGDPELRRKFLSEKGL